MHGIDRPPSAKLPSSDGWNKAYQLVTGGPLFLNALSNNVAVTGTDHSTSTAKSLNRSANLWPSFTRVRFARVAESVWSKNILADLDMRNVPDLRVTGNVLGKNFPRKQPATDGPLIAVGRRECS